MKKLQIQNKSYNHLLKSFKEWLDVLGYSESTVYNLPNHIREFLHYLEQRNIQRIDLVHTEVVTDYYKHLTIRGNERREGGLSAVYLNKHRQALMKFKEYLNEHQQKSFYVHLKTEKVETFDRHDILTQKEVQQLFNACNYSHLKNRIKLRDKAILTLLYSCGLRRSEAVHLNLSDIQLDRQLIYVRKAKNFKERFVPFNNHSKVILEDYMFEARPQFFNVHLCEALLINQRGKRLGGQSLENRLKVIVGATENETLQQKHITPHQLRHAIATHLLQQEVKIEVISQFLGHSSLESTQIYTHLIDNNTNGIQRLLKAAKLHHTYH